MRRQLLISSALVGATAGLFSTHDAEARESFDADVKTECERAVLRARVARVRAQIVQAGAVVEEQGVDGRRVAQWYNWGDWPNGWNNYWNDWPNDWWNG